MKWFLTVMAAANGVNAVANIYSGDAAMAAGAALVCGLLLGVAIPEWVKA